MALMRRDPDITAVRFDDGYNDFRSLILVKEVLFFIKRINPRINSVENNTTLYFLPSLPTQMTPIGHDNASNQLKPVIFITSVNQ